MVADSLNLDWIYC